MFQDRNIQILKKFFSDVDNATKTVADLAPYFADGYKDFDRSPLSPPDLSDKDAHLAFFGALKSGFRDFSHMINLLEPTKGGRYLVYWTFQGRHVGDFFGVPATDRQARTNGIDIYTVQND
ncbi:MAG: ester cyclase, partial [Pseudomonadota bacterium]